MQTFLRSCALLALPLLPLSTAAAAYDPAIIAADARWVLFADLNALRGSTVGKELVTALEKAQTEATKGTIRIDIPKLLATIGSITAYGSNLTPDPTAMDGALIAQGTADLRKIAESVLLQGTLGQPDMFTELTDLPFPAYAISDPEAKGEAKQKMQVIVAFPPEPIVVVSKSRAQLLKARDVFRGSGASLAKARSSPLTKLGANAADAYVFAASVAPTETGFPQNGPQARILQLANSGAIALGEKGEDTFAHAEMLASSGQNAERLMKILQGMTAMLSLAESNDRQLAEFLHSTKVTREQDTVTLHLSYPSARLVQMAQNLHSQMKPRPTNRQPQITMGKPVDEWNAAEVEAADGAEVNGLSWRTIENVKLVHGATISLGRALNGGKPGKFQRVEILPAEGSGAPLTFDTEFMRQRGSLSQVQFPGVEGLYTLRVAYMNDPERKAKFAVSVRDPKPAAPEQPEPPHRGPLIPEPKMLRK